MALTQVKVKQGWLEGQDCGKYTVFKGIPYAKPPVGELRFGPPRELTAWEGIKKVQKFPNVCWQGEPQQDTFYNREFYQNTWKNEKRSEDCLYLNIWTPAVRSSDKLPVLFWIHGGAFNHGYGHEQEFDGEAYCKQGIILVTIQYRLGIFGFLAHPWLNKGRNCGNLALLDQIFALQWVYKNIAGFGGDEENITVAGQSAGGVSVQALLTSHFTKGMIRRAILQSGGGFGQLKRRSISGEEALDIGVRWAEEHGIKAKEDLYRMDAETLYHCSVGFPCKFVLDGFLLPERGEDVLYEVSSGCEAFMLGSTRDDIRVTAKMLTEGRNGDLYLGNISFAEKMCDANNVYLYYFTHQLPGDEAGAFHSSELWYTFGTLRRCWRPFEERDFKLSKKMIEHWSHFIKTGKADADSKVWKPYQKNDPFIMAFQSERKG